MGDERYTNAELSQAYFEVMAQNASNQKYMAYKKDRKNIKTTEENIQEYFEKHGSLANINITKIEKTGPRGIEKRKILERTIVDGKDIVKKEIQDSKISLDFLKWSKN